MATATKKDKEKKTEDDSSNITMKEALSLLSTTKEDKETKIHTLQGFSFAIVGCNISLTKIKKLLKESKHICLSGPNMRGMGHGVAFLEGENGYTFLETDKKKLDEFYLEKKIKQ